MNNKRIDLSISYIRLTAFLFIFTCHVMQYYDLKFAFWINVGVQIFIFISGYLYGKYDFASGVLTFYKKRILKILPTYYFWVSLVIVVAFIVDGSSISFKSIATLGLVFGANGFSSLSHLWYIRYILIFYLLCPLIVKLLDVFEKSKIRFINCLVLFCLVTVLVGAIYLQHFDVSLLVCFILGGGYRRVEQTKDSWIFKLLCTILLVITLGVYVGIESPILGDLKSNGYIIILQDQLNAYAHVFLGALLFIALKKLYGKCSDCKLRALSDKYSYYLYLTHQVFVLGMFSMFRLFDSFITALIIALFLTVFFAFILNVFQICFEKVLKKFKR